MSPGVNGVWSRNGAGTVLATAPPVIDGPLGLVAGEVWTDTRKTVLVSGEVVLHPATRRSLGPAAGATDGELLAEAIARNGIEVVEKIDGAFAVAVWEFGPRRLHLVRDHVGQRTLYYARAGNDWWFANTLANLEANPSVHKSLSMNALRDYLIYSFVPGSQTMWQEISELRPGTVLSLPEGETDSYYEPLEEPDTGEDLVTHAARLRAVLEDRVNPRLAGNEPVGVYLSGGVDSSLVAALVARAHTGPVHTYSLHFGAAYRNELQFSDMVAEQYGTHHQTIEITAPAVAAALRQTMESLDDPIGDPLTAPNFLMGKAAAKDVKVIFNGEGGDPCFGGPKNQPMLLQQVYPGPLDRETAYLRSFQKCYADLPELLQPWVKSELAQSDPVALLRPFFETERMSQYLNRLMYINVRLKGADHILTKVQNLTRANGLLAHSPLFDREIVDLSFAIPPRFKLSSTEEKVVLKAAVSDIVPEAVLSRPKSGMMVPVQGWFRTELRRFSLETLWGGKSAGSLPGLRNRKSTPTERDAMIWRYLEPEPAARWLKYEGSGRHGLKLWMLISLELWLQTHAHRKQAPVTRDLQFAFA